MTLFDVYEAEQELLENPPIHHLFADYLATRYGAKVRKRHHSNSHGSQEELRELHETFGKGLPNG